MPIVNSVVTQDNHIQKNGSRYIRERHTDSNGEVHIFEYLATEGADINSILTSRAARLETSLTEREIQSILDGIVS